MKKRRTSLDVAHQARKQSDNTWKSYMKSHIEKEKIDQEMLGSLMSICNTNDELFFEESYNRKICSLISEIRWKKTSI